jgi:hypothetical protein
VRAVKIIDNASIKIIDVDLADEGGTGGLFPVRGVSTNGTQNWNKA